MTGPCTLSQDEGALHAERNTRRMISRSLTLLLMLVVSVVASSSGQLPTDKTSSLTLSLAPDEPLPGMPPVPDPNDIYSETRPGKLNPAVRDFPLRLYVPNGISNTVDVIDPDTYQIIDSFPADEEPQHVVPSYDLKKLWVLNNQGDSLTPIDPSTGKNGETVHVDDPYNLYFTPDGQYALVVAERLRRLDFRDPQTMQLRHSLAVPCRGVNHRDYSVNGRYLIASCEFSNELKIGRAHV